MVVSDNDRDPLEALATEFVERCRAGAAPTVEDYARRYPDLAADIRDLFPTILAVELAKGGTTVGLSGAGPVNSPPIARLGDYRIVRELGRGGMGIVYEAVQESLDRRVAIKVLPLEFARDSTRKERFAREARTAARLHHTNIVPIFGVGEHEGRPYFVMQYIAGVGLDTIFRDLVLQRARAAADGASRSDPFTTSDSVLRAARDAVGLHEPAARAPEASTPKFPPGVGKAANPERRRDYWVAVASLIAQAADALHFAHSQGVLHRDVKPSNLLVDAEGGLWVTDFGLAKALEHDDLTEAGDVIGTLRYLAPEQFEGRSDARSDVYSLGVTAFELATLTPAFASAGRSSLIRAIVDGESLRPRARCPQMPADLETILLKATARAPADRYSSAADLRDDLRRFVDDLPILARRSTTWERARRWSRRNPALATAGALVFALLFSTAFISTAAFWSVRRANDRTSAALLGETRQRERAEATSELAVDALDTVLNELAPDEFQAPREFSLDGTDENTLPVAAPTVVTPETANLLGHLLAFYERLAAQHDESEQLLLKAAAANRRVGEIYELLGRYADADAAYRTAVDAYGRLSSGVGQSAVVLRAQTLNQLGGSLVGQDKMFEAQMEFDGAARLLEPLVAENEASADARFELARSYYLAARRSSLRLPPDPEPLEGPRDSDGRRPLGAGREDRRGPAQGLPPGPPGGSPPGPNRRRARLGPGPEGEPGRRREHQLELDRGLELLEGLSAEAPDEPKYLHLAALCMREREAMRAGPAGQPKVDEVVRRLEHLVERFPAVPRYRFDLAETLVVQDRGPDGVQQVRRALAILQTLVDERPDVPTYRFALGHGHLRLSHVYEAGGDRAAAMEQARLALSVHSGLASEHPEASAFAVTTSLCESVVARLLQDGGDLEGAKQMLLSATARLTALEVMDDPRPHIRAFAGRCFDQLSRVYHALGDHERAREALERARFLGPGPRFGP